MNIAKEEFPRKLSEPEVRAAFRQYAVTEFVGEPIGIDRVFRLVEGEEVERWRAAFRVP